MSYFVRKKCVLILGCVLALLSQVQATVISEPLGLLPGDQYRLVFVTAGLKNAQSTSIADYNTFVTEQAMVSEELNGLNVSWYAIASTADIDAIDNTSTATSVSDISIYNLAGEAVAGDYMGLWSGTLGHAIGYDQYGNALSGAVFTGTAADGLGLADRQLGAVGYRVQMGNSGNTTASWVTLDWSGSLNELHYYAISDVITVPDVPEPGSMTLFGIMGMVCLRRKK